MAKFWILSNIRNFGLIVQKRGPKITKSPGLAIKNQTYHSYKNCNPQHNVELNVATKLNRISVVMLSVIMLRVVKPARTSRAKTC